MTSLIKVDSIQTSSGGTATASSLGIGGVGKIGQVIEGSTTTETTINSTSYSDITGLTASITPSSTSSKILVVWTTNFDLSSGTADNVSSYLKTLRDSTQIGAYSKIRIEGYVGVSHGTVSFTCLDSPSTTSALTYKVQANINATASSRVAYFTNDHGSVNGWSQITLMEVLA